MAKQATMQPRSDPPSQPRVPKVVKWISSHPDMSVGLLGVAVMNLYRHGPQVRLTFN